MNKFLLPLLGFFFLAVPVYANVNLTVNGTDIAPAFINTIDRTAMLNLTFNITGDIGVASSIVNVTYINVTIINSSFGFNISNITAVEIINASGDVIASNTTNSSASNFTIFFIRTNGFVVNSSHGNSSFIISLNISSAGALDNATGVNISANSSIVTAGNINITVGSNRGYTHAYSNFSRIADIHASASVSPRYVDTFTINQTMIYTINVTGRDDIGNVTITLPVEYTNISIQQIKKDGSVVSTDVTSSNVSSKINITFTTAAGSSIIINFTVNSSVATGNLTLNTTLKDYRLNTTANDNNTGVSVSPIITIHSIVGSKLTALPNGTDYWEFNFTLNFSANISGGFMFRMLDWTNNASQTINVNTTNTSYAEVRLDADGTKSANITNSYVLSRYLPMTLVSTSQQRIALKMILPAGTPVSSTWWSTYFMLFRTDP
ncbi:MAG: hypothetical protein HY364_05260 [Candidatus Aenigmarchaeota archaeon]|nr:hypothetical protein [Candidatus Aenigmarchaeota archaeon]